MGDVPIEPSDNNTERAHCFLVKHGRSVEPSREPGADRWRDDLAAEFAAARRAGAEEMRERAARRAGSLFAMPEEMRDELSASAPDHEDLIAANCGVVIENAIRALPLEG